MKIFLPVLSLFLVLHSGAQNNLLMVTVLDGNGLPAKKITVNIHNTNDKLLTSLQTDSAGTIQYLSNQLILNLDIRSDNLNFKSTYDRCYLLQNDTTQKIYVLYNRSKEDAEQLRRGLEKLPLTTKEKFAHLGCPDFISGMGDPEKQKEIYTCLISSLNYPTEAVETALEGKIRIRFVVDENDQIRDMQIVGGSYAILEEEALRAAACLSGIGAATCEGKKVPTMYNLPVSFKLN